MAHQHRYEQKFPSFSDALYCEEEEWEEGVDDREEHSFFANAKDPKPPLEQDLMWEEDELCSLFNKEKEFDFCNNGLLVEMNPLMADARSEAVEWMLKVTAYYSFSAGTAFLAISYLDRFLFGIESNKEKKPWMTQLAAVACLSLAAKVEETCVPLLLDLQVEESKYLFEAKTIQRMEILVLSSLQWKMNIVTPLSFVDYVTRRLGLKNQRCWEFLRRCECILFSIISDSRFICYLPSIIATATMLHVLSSGNLFPGEEFQEQLLGILQIHKNKVEECYRLMSEVASTSYMHSSNKRKFNGGMPGSPKGVMDVSFSSDSSNDSWALASSPEPSSKRGRVTDQPESDLLECFPLPLD